jgi:malate synthase
VNRAAAEAIRADKKWEAEHGFLRGWVAHIFHMKVAGDPFKELIDRGFTPSAEMADPTRYPVRIEVPKGPITVDGTRRNARMLVEYVEGWLNGRGAKGIDSLAGKPGIHPALMEDLATGRMSTAQIAQRVLHRVRSDEGTVHDFALVRRLLEEETADIIRLGSLSGEAAARYQKAAKIAAQWIRNYTVFDFRSLGSYTRADLERIAGGVEGF